MSTAINSIPGSPGAVLWDLDGTLIDSEEYHWLSWRETMAAEGILITREQFLASFGHRNDEILTEWLGASSTGDRLQRISATKEHLFRQLIRERGLSPLPGAREWILQLSRRGWQQAIASSAPRENVETVLSVLDVASHFQAIASAEDVTAGKPDPQVFLIAASRVHTSPSKCIVVEDAVGGIEAARRAGMRCVGVRQTLSADVTVSSLTELPADTFSSLLDKNAGV